MLPEFVCCTSSSPKRLFPNPRWKTSPIASDLRCQHWKTHQNTCQACEEKIWSIQGSTASRVAFFGGGQLELVWLLFVCMYTIPCIPVWGAVVLFVLFWVCDFLDRAIELIHTRDCDGLQWYFKNLPFCNHGTYQASTKVTHGKHKETGLSPWISGSFPLTALHPLT